MTTSLLAADQKQVDRPQIRPELPRSGARLIISTNSAWSMVKYRGGLISALIADGHEVIAVAPPDEYADELAQLDCRYIPLPMDKKGKNPARDVQLFLQYRKIFKRERPDAYLGFSIKPNVYGSLAAHALGIPVINNVNGLGTVFIRDGWLKRVACQLYRLAFARSIKVFFHNADDRHLFLQHKLVVDAQSVILPGSGVDLEYFRPAPQQQTSGFQFLLIGRLIYDKGVSEFVEAARLLKATRPSAECGLLGFVQSDNPTAVSRDDVERWQQAGLIRYRGSADDVRQHIAEADCIVLPSYREGAPRVLLEAAAMARPVIGTDVPGCRAVIDEGRTGLLCAVKDPQDLAEKMIAMVDMDPGQRRSMGAAGRQKMEREYDQRLVFDAYRTTLHAIFQATSRPPAGAEAMSPREPKRRPFNATKAGTT